jgi:hypothetical protein
MKSLVLTLEQAQRLADGIASLPIPYTASRPLMMILESARVIDVPDPEADKARVTDGG